MASKWNAKREATARLRENRAINDAEFAYSPETGAVGCEYRFYAVA